MPTPTLRPPIDPTDAHVVLMAKRPVPGRVKTRLTPPLSPAQAAEAHAAMMACIAARLRRWAPGRHVLALDLGAAEGTDADARDTLPEGVDAPGWRVVPQGPGDLGERMARVWRGLGGGPVAFFGVDSPDAPIETLAGLWAPLRDADAALGPSHDGGYWTLLARSLDAGGPLLRGIDWGTDAVYDQTLEQGRACGLAIAELPRWLDVDDAADLAELLERLRSQERSPQSPDARDDALPRLLRRLARLPIDPRSPRPGPTEPDPLQDPAMADPTTPAAGVSNAPPRPETEADPAAEHDAIAQSRVLIVDDNEQNVELMQAYLEALPCAVEVAYDGQQALARVEDPDLPKPDLILLDVMMPKISGFEVCRKLKDDPTTRAIPVMMVTALNELGDIERGVESGTDDFVTKPVNKLELVTRCKSLLRVRQLKRDLERTEAHLRGLEERRGG